MVSLKEMSRCGLGAQQPSRAALVVAGVHGSLGSLRPGRAAAMDRCCLGARRPERAAWSLHGLNAGL